MPARYTSARFVGRDETFARFAAVLGDAAAGRAGAVLLDGTAGIGSTRFLDEAVRRVGALAEPMLVLRGGAYGPGTDRPYGPFIRALGPVLAALDDAELDRVLGTATDALMHVLPGLADRVGPRPDDRPALTTVPERRQARLLEGVLGVVGRLSERQPTLAIVEDLHRADAGTRTLVSFLARIARDQRLAVVGTYQSDAVRRIDPWPAAMAALAAAPRPPARLSLGPLGRDDLARLMAEIEGERPSASVLVVVAERSEGRPLVAEELLAARRELPSVSLTGSFEDLVMARVAARSPECRRVMRMLAPAGRPISRTTLSIIGEVFETGSTGGPPRSSTGPRRGDGIMDADLVAGLDEALEHGLAVETEAGVGLRHELVGRAIEADLLPAIRVRHHAAVAVALADQPFAALHHHLVAHDTRGASSAAIAAADEAAAMDAPEDELDALETAIATRPAGPRQDGIALGLRAAEAAFAAGRASRAVAYLDATLGAADARRDRTRLGLIHDRLGQFRRVIGDADGALAARRRAVGLVPSGNTPARATVVAGLAQALMLEGTFSEAERLSGQAIRIARACDPPERHWELHALTTLGVSMGWRSDPEAAIATLQEARALAEELGELDELFRVYANLTTVLDLVGRHEDAVLVAREGIAAARAAGLEAVYGNVLRGNAADSLFLLGRWEEARAMSRTALEWLPAGVNFLNTLVALAAVEIELDAGEAAGRLLGQTLLELEAVRDAQQAVPLHLAAASFALWRGDVADARRAADRGWELIRDTEDWILAARTAATVAEVNAAAAVEAQERRDLAALAAARERARTVVADAGAIVRRHGVDPSLGSRRLADTWLAAARAHAQRVAGRDSAAAWETIAERWDALGVPVRDGSRVLARRGGSPRLGRRTRRPGGRSNAAPRRGRDRDDPRRPAPAARSAGPCGPRPHHAPGRGR